MTAPVTRRTLPILQELEEKSRQTTSLKFFPLCSLVNTTALTSYNVDLEADLYFSAMASYSSSMCTRPNGFQR